MAAYAEPLVDGCRVIVFGDASSKLAEHLVERGARLVHVYDANQGRVAQATTLNTSARISIAPLGERGLAVRDGSFDLAVIESLAMYDDPRLVLRQARRALSSRGVALVASPNPSAQSRLLPLGEGGDGGIDYYELYDLLQSELDEVQMLGQAPFTGYTVAHFGPESEPEPVLDTAFVPGGAEEPEQYLALAGDLITADLPLFAVIQIPCEGVLESNQPTADRAEHSNRADREARDRIAALEAELERVREELFQEKTRTQADDEARELRRELERRDEWLSQLEARAATADARADDALEEMDALKSKLRQSESGDKSALHAAQVELRSLRTQLAETTREASATARVQAELREARAELAKQEERANTAAAARDEAAALKSQLEAGARRIDELEAELAEQGARLSKLLGVEDANTTEEITHLEGLLRERGGEIRRLEVELRKGERVGRELLLELERVQSEANESGAGIPDELRQKLDALADRNAQQEADLTTARWRIEALEGALSNNTGESSTSAVIQRQATLLAQVGTKPSPH